VVFPNLDVVPSPRGTYPRTLRHNPMIYFPGFSSSCLTLSQNAVEGNEGA
jgi:hypothetical protein